MDENRLDALAASLARTDGRRRSTARVLGRWLRGAPPHPPADGPHSATLAGPDLARRRLVIRGAAAAGAAVWVPPIIQSITSPAAAAGSPPPTSTCAPSQEFCSSDGDCCLGHCEETTCCNLSGTGQANFCVDGSDCCNFHDCVNSHCCGQSRPGNPASCMTADECCTTGCVGAGPGVFGTCCNPSGNQAANVCLTDADCCDQHPCLNGHCCTPEGDGCTADAQCCTTACISGVCTAT